MTQQDLDPTTTTMDESGLNADQMIVDAKGDELYYRTYRSEEEDLAGVKRLIDQELSEPYVPFSYLMYGHTYEIDTQVSCFLLGILQSMADR